MTSTPSNHSANLAPAEQSPAQQLIVELRSNEAYTNPNPSTYRAAAEVMHGYFTEKAGEIAAGRDPRFEHAVDHVVSALGGFYARDESTHQLTSRATIGQHPADSPLMLALNAAARAQSTVEETGRQLPSSNSEQTRSMLGELSNSHDSNTSGRPLRHRAADALRAATRSVDSDPVAYQLLAEAGMYATEAIVSLADIAGLHEKDTGSVGVLNTNTSQLETHQGDVPQMKDYLMRHMADALDAATA